MLDNAPAHGPGKHGHTGRDADGQGGTEHKEKSEPRAAEQPLDGYREVKVDLHMRLPLAAQRPEGVFVNVVIERAHTRDEILQLSAGVGEQAEVNTEELQIQLHEQETTISNLETTSNVRLYTGLAQGAIIGLVTGGAIAWVVSRRIEYVDVDTENHEEESEGDE